MCTRVYCTFVFKTSFSFGRPVRKAPIDGGGGDTSVFGTPRANQRVSRAIVLEKRLRNERHGDDDDEYTDRPFCGFKKKRL